jgi:hypothetical protein
METTTDDIEHDDSETLDDVYDREQRAQRQASYTGWLKKFEKNRTNVLVCVLFTLFIIAVTAIGGYQASRN